MVDQRVARVNFNICVRTMKQSCKSTKNTEKRSGNHIEYADGITIYAIVRDTGRGPTNLVHSSGSYIIAAIKNLSRFMDVTYPSDEYDIGAYRVHRSLFFLRKQKHMQAVDLFCGYIHCRTFASMTRKSIVAPDPRRVQNDEVRVGMLWSSHTYSDSKPIDRLHPKDVFPLFVSRSWTGVFGALLIPFHDTMEFPNGCTDIWRQTDNKLMGDVPKYVRPKYKVSRTIFNCPISDWRWPVCFSFVLTSMPAVVAWQIVASCRLAARVNHL